MENNIFLIETEYHLYLAITIIYTHFKQSTNHIYITRRRINKNFIADEKFIVFHDLPGENYGTKYTLQDMISLSPARFFYYQEDRPDSVYLTYNLHKKGVRISLVQDGIKPYSFPIRNYKHPIIHLVLDTWRLFKEMISRRTLIPKLVLVKNYYGYLPYNDEFWLQYPDKFVNVKNKELIKIPERTDEIIKAINKYFGFDASKYDPGAILFVAEYMIKYSDCMKVEKMILTYLIKKYPDKKIYYKIHPGTPQHSIDEIAATYPNISIIDDGIPAELHICNLKHSLILSMYSTALLTNNQDCRFYWTWKLYPSDNRLLSQVNPCNPTKHIVEINCLDEIQ